MRLSRHTQRTQAVGLAQQSRGGLPPSLGDIVGGAQSLLASVTLRHVQQQHLCTASHSCAVPALFATETAFGARRAAQVVCDDDDIRPTQPARVLSDPNAYLLIYERKDKQRQGQ